MLSTPASNLIFYWDFLRVKDLALVALIFPQCPAHSTHPEAAHQINNKSTAVLVSKYQISLNCI